MTMEEDTIAMAGAHVAGKRAGIATTWDTDTAAAVLAATALIFLIAIRRGFRPVLVSS